MKSDRVWYGVVSVCVSFVCGVLGGHGVGLLEGVRGRERGWVLQSLSFALGPRTRLRGKHGALWGCWFWVLVAIVTVSPDLCLISPYCPWLWDAVFRRGGTWLTLASLLVFRTTWISGKEWVLWWRKDMEGSGSDALGLNSSSITY